MNDPIAVIREVLEFYRRSDNTQTANVALKALDQVEARLKQGIVVEQVCDHPELRLGRVVFVKNIIEQFSDEEILKEIDRRFKAAITATGAK